MKKLTFEEVIDITEKLADKIKTSGYQPDYLIGIPTGGLFPLALLAKELKTKNILTTSYLPKLQLENKKILLIDEITESGVTLQKILEKVKKIYPSCEIRTAALGVNKDKCKFYPDYFIFFEEGDWVVFPWEKEDFPEYKS